MSVDILKALDYLHNDAKLLHGDLKSYNILVRGNFEICKLCDFGVSLPLDKNGFIIENKKYIGTELWSAPEVIDQVEKICYKADIFSFGLVIYETIALIPPHTWNLRNNENNGNDDEEESVDQENGNDDELSFREELAVNDCIDMALGTRPPLPEAFSLDNNYDKIVEIFYLCTNEFPEDRPNAHDLHLALTTTNSTNQ